MSVSQDARPADGVYKKMGRVTRQNAVAAEESPSVSQESGNQAQKMQGLNKGLWQLVDSGGGQLGSGLPPAKANPATLADPKPQARGLPQKPGSASAMVNKRP
jgi:hypothetical protein